MKHGRPRIAAIAPFLIVVASAYASEIELLCPPPPEDISEGSREWERDRVCRSLLDLEDELGIDSNARHQIVDALTDHQRAQSNYHSSSTAERDIGAAAGELTNTLSRVRGAIGDERMESYYVYMHSGRERHLMGILTRSLSAGDALTPEQRSQMMAAFSRHVAREKLSDGPELWAPVNRHEFSSEDQSVISAVNNIARWQLNSVRALELNAQLETEAATFLTAKQVQALERMNERQHRDSTKYLLREWMKIDPAKLRDLQARIAALPRQQMPPVVPGDIDIHFDIAIDDRKPLAGTRTVANGGVLTLDADELRIEIKPTLYKRSFFGTYAQVEVDALTKVAGEWRRLEQPSRQGNSEGYSLSLVEGVRKSYFLKYRVVVDD